MRLYREYMRAYDLYLERQAQAVIDATKTVLAMKLPIIATPPPTVPSHSWQIGDRVKMISTTWGYTLVSAGSTGVVCSRHCALGPQWVKVKFDYITTVTCGSIGPLPAPIMLEVVAQDLEWDGLPTLKGLQAWIPAGFTMPKKKTFDLENLKVISDDHQCSDHMLNYTGLTDTFRYCKICDKKERN